MCLNNATHRKVYTILVGCFTVMYDKRTGEKESCTKYTEYMKMLKNVCFLKD